MKVIYTRHSEEKLTRTDIRKFKINKKLIEKILKNPMTSSRTKYGDYAAIGDLDERHILRIIYVIMNSDYKTITFHVARKGRYR